MFLIIVVVVGKTDLFERQPSLENCAPLVLNKINRINFLGFLKKIRFFFQSSVLRLASNLFLPSLEGQVPVLRSPQ
jgi:hypothetical protein